MDSKAAEERISELKMEYIRAQDDLEKLESVGVDPSSAQKRLSRIENELSELRNSQDE
ncbi:SE1832 family protein [Jeotgalibacillus proteolyticus]|uniref:SE1832 family protein n=1 Tax=Jeotgalibacillus proteolyticus TaxID=2082395 RepID=UPI001431769F|nr:SE1832 family protein [Jeotgalibacillus proteolyticus]